MWFLALHCGFGIFLSNCCRDVTCFPIPDADIVLHFITGDSSAFCSEVNVLNTLYDSMLTCNSLVF